MTSKDGFSWTPSGGFSEGLPTIGLVSPPTSILPGQENEIYDAIVIGAGYAGLTAARDLATQGQKTLLLEGRDRLGGRTWNTVIDGFNYELGGTWLHWHMPHIYREISYYGLQNDWVVTQNPGSKEDYCTLTYGSKQLTLSHPEEDDMAGRVWSLFCNMDGDYQRQSWKYAFGTGQSAELLSAWDKLSCQDRLDQIKDQLSAQETAMLTTILQQMGGNTLDRMGLVNALHWWTLGSHTPLGLNQIALHTRLASGNSTLHCRMFEHAVSSGNLSYSFSTPVSSIRDERGIATVKARGGQEWRARAVICTVPLNVLSSLQFSPPLPEDKQKAAARGQVNKCNKVHAEIGGPDLLSWTSAASPGAGLVSLFGDRLTPAGNTHVVGFGPDPESSNGMVLRDINAVQKSISHLLPDKLRDTVELKRIVSHDWNNDEFSRGTWCFLPTESTTAYVEALQRRHGNVFFASADWSDGWRGWIDGAVHIGMKVAQEVCELQQQRKQAFMRNPPRSSL